MNNFRWLATLFNIRKPMRMFRNMRGRRNNLRTISLPLISLGAAVLFYGYRRGANNQLFKPIQNLINNVQSTFQNSNVRTRFAEFANEITPQNDLLKNKTN